MKYLKNDVSFVDADSAEDTQQPSALYEARIADLQQRVIELPPGHTALDKAELQIGIAALLIELEHGEEAWDVAREAFDVYVAAASWEGAVQACHILFQADQSASLSALGQGVWLAVTFPEVDPELTVAMLEHIVDDTPPDSDGAAVAAATACYIINLRTEGKIHENLSFFTSQMIAAVARRHADVDNQVAFDSWLNRLELQDPEKLLVRLRNVIDVMVQDDWWIDREAIWASLPVN